MQLRFIELINTATLPVCTVIPGYDDTKVNKPGRIAYRKGGQVYRTLWEDAIRARPDWVLITLLERVARRNGD